MTEKELQIRQLEHELSILKREIERKIKENRIEIYNVGKVHKKQVEFHKDAHRIKALFGGNRCLVAGQKVYMADGSTKPIEEIRVGDMVLAYDLETCETVPTKVINAGYSGVKRCKKIKLGGYAELECSFDHPILTKTKTDSNFKKWRIADDLCVGRMKVIIAKSLNVNPCTESLTPEFCKLLGYLIGDGSFVGDTIRFTNTRPEIVKDFLSVIPDGFHVRQHTESDYYISVPNGLKHGNWIITKLREMGLWGKRSWEKHIPIEIFGQSHECIKEFIKGLYATDGWVSVQATHKGTEYWSYGYSTTSQVLAEDLKRLLLVLGIHATIKCKKRVMPQRDEYSVMVSESTSVDLMPDIPYKGRPPKREKIRTQKYQRIFDKAKQITHIEETGFKPVFDLTIEHPDHAFIVNGIVVHNTGKTVAGAVESVCHALGYSRFRPLEPSSGWVVSLTNEVQRDVAQKEILRWLPKKEIKDFIIRHGRKDDPENSILDKIVLKNGQAIGFKTVEQGRESFQGTSQGWIWFDEEPTKEVFDECKMRVVDTRGDMWFTMTPLKGLTWIYNTIYLNEQNDPEIVYWMMEWEDNPWLEKEEIDRMIANMTEEEREARQYGRFTSLCGFAFPELRKEIHVVKPKITVPSWYKRYVALDYGFDSLAAIWVWIDNYGKGRIYRALRKKNLIISEAAKEILKFTGNEKIESYYAPPDLWNRRQDTGKSAAMIFYENGIMLTKVSNDREQGWLNVHEWLKPYETRDEQTGETYKTANLTIDEGVDPDLWKHLTTIQKDEKNINDVATQPHDITHYPDAVRYFCASRLMPSNKPETERKYNFKSERPHKDDYGMALGDGYDESFFDYGGF